MKRLTSFAALFAALFAGASVARAQTAPAAAAAAPQAYFEFQVERTVLPLPGSPPPAYPAELRASKVEGEVLAQFIVGPDGRPEMSTFKVLKSSNDLFTAAVYDALKNARFKPAEIGGHRVRQVVQQPYVFALGH